MHTEHSLYSLPLHTATLHTHAQQSFPTIVLACYLFAFACILCCFETHLKAIARKIAENFGFLYNAKGRAVFLLFVGILCFR
jgi:COPI associated protein